jgi:hypothetical protein
MSVTRRNLLATAALLAPAGYAATTPKRPTEIPEVWSRTELYFGTNKPDNQPVTDAEFTRFVDTYVTERFPDGLTLLTAYGQFRNSRGELIREKSFLLILLYQPQMQDAGKRIEEIRSVYKDTFSQESVLRVDSFSFVSF